MSYIWDLKNETSCYKHTKIKLHTCPFSTQIIYMTCLKLHICWPVFLWWYQGRRDVTLGIPQSRPLGWKWRCVGVERPSAGKLVSNLALESALPTKVNFTQKHAEFTQKEWAAFGIAHLHFDDYIMLEINDVAHYFYAAAGRFKQWACEWEASEEYKQMTLRTSQTAPQWLQKGGSAHDGLHSRNLANWNGQAQYVCMWNKSALIWRYLLCTRLHAWWKACVGSSAKSSGSSASSYVVSHSTRSISQAILTSTTCCRQWSLSKSEKE